MVGIFGDWNLFGGRRCCLPPLMPGVFVWQVFNVLPITLLRYGPVSNEKPVVPSTPTVGGLRRYYL